MRIIKFNFDKLLNSLVFVFSCALIITQLFLLVSKFNSYLTQLSGGEYIYTSAEALKDKTIELKLVLKGIKPSEEIFVLQNGEPISVFTTACISVVISDNSVIEIDGRAFKNDFSVLITDSDGKSLENLPKRVNVKSNIAMVGRVILD